MRIKPSNKHNQPPLMHEALFEGLYGHLIAYLAEQGIKEMAVDIRTDQIDKSTVNNFKRIADEFLSNDPYRRDHTGWDTVTEKVVKGHIQIDIEFPPILDIGLAISCQINNIIDEGDVYIVAADVIANSLYHLFKNRDQSERYEPLNPSLTLDPRILVDFSRF